MLTYNAVHAAILVLAAPVPTGLFCTSPPPGWHSLVEKACDSIASCHYKTCDAPDLSPSECSCMPACLQHADCCYDAPLKCSWGEHQLSTSRYQCLAIPALGVSVESRENNNGYLLIDQCHNQTDNSLRNNCESSFGNNKSEKLTMNDLHQKLPAYSPKSGAFYKNRYCAECNGETEVIVWSVQVSCDDDALLLEQKTSSPLFLLGQRLPGCEVSAVPVGLPAQPRQCFAQAVSTCKDANVDSETATLCGSYSAYIKVEVNNTDVLFKNPHCALCNGVEPQDNPTATCRMGTARAVGPKPLSYYGLLNFNPRHLVTSLTTDEASGNRTCLGDRVYVRDGRGHGTCRALHCPRGMSVLPGTMQCVLHDFKQQYFFTLSIQQPSISEVSRNRIQDNLPAFLKQHILRYTHLWQVNVDIVNTAETTRFDASTKQYHPVLVFTIRIEFFNTIIDTVEMDEKAIANSVGLLVGQDVVVDKKSLLVVKILQLGTFPRITKLGCPLVELKKNEFVFRDELSSEITLLSGSKQTLYRDQYATDDGRVFVCIDHLLKQPAKGLGSASDELLYGPPEWLTVFTMFLTAMSIICLLLAIITRLLFAELRTSAGKNSLNLMIAMLCMQSTFLVHPYFTFSLELCKAVAMLLHYLLLVCFASMNVCMFNLYFTFTHLFDSQKRNRKATYWRQVAYAWSAPLLIIIPCIIIDLCQCSSFLQYASSTTCWVGGVHVRLVTIAIPIMIAVLANIIFFVSTFRAIKNSTNRVRHRSSMHCLDTRQHIVVCLRITVLIGFTWLLPLFLNIDQPATSYRVLLVFSEIANSLQGVFVFIAYTVNGRVWFLYTDACQRKRHNSSDPTLELADSQSKRKSPTVGSVV